MFQPRVALASLSGQSDADWARNGEPHAGTAVLGGIAIDGPTRDAALAMVERDRTEFLPADPGDFIKRQFDALADAPLRPAINVRAVSPDSIPPVARVCARHDGILELNAHCRQTEMCRAGAGESLLADRPRLCESVQAAARTGAAVSVKVRAETGVDLPALARAIERAGADAIHVDAMDSEAVVADLARATDLFIIANNGIRDRETTLESLEYGADAVSVGRASDDLDVLARVRATTEAWFEGRESPQEAVAGARMSADRAHHGGGVTSRETRDGEKP